MLIVTEGRRNNLQGQQFVFLTQFKLFYYILCYLQLSLHHIAYEPPQYLTRVGVAGLPNLVRLALSVLFSELNAVCSRHQAPPPHPNTSPIVFGDRQLLHIAAERLQLLQQ